MSISGWLVLAWLGISWVCVCWLVLVGWCGTARAGGLDGELRGLALTSFFCSACWKRICR